jgi:hypothetical protein
MKKYCNIFFLLFSLICLGNKAKCASAANPFNSYILHSSAFALHAASMDGNSPHKKQTLILFRNGIEEKNISYSSLFISPSSFILECAAVTSKINPVRIKYVLSFSHFLIIEPEFLSSFSFRAPPDYI